MATSHHHARPSPIVHSRRVRRCATRIEQTQAMAWRALLKMRRNPEQFFDVTLQPLLFTAMFTYIFGGAVAGSTASYLPIIIPGILAQTTLTACMATGIQLREDMDKGVFDRFKSLPIARIAPLAGPRSPTCCATGSRRRSRSSSASRWATGRAAASRASWAAGR